MSTYTSPVFTASRPRTNGRTAFSVIAAAVLALAPLAERAAGAEPRLAPIIIADDGDGFRYADSGERFTPWGFNYNRDREMRLVESFWVDEWDRVVRHFRTMRDLGANAARIHLQTRNTMAGPDEVNRENLARLARLIDLADETGIYLNITGLGSYYKDKDPAWYRDMDEADRWAVQARFWKAVAEVCAGKPAVFCYDLMNEPVLKEDDEWLPGEGLAGMNFTQNITRDRAGRTRAEIARAWVDQLVGAIREVDGETPVTVGVIPWVFHWGGGKPLFYGEEVRANLDFASVHFYPRHGKIDEALEALKAYDVGLPLVIEETAPLRCSMEELADFIERSRAIADGWYGFYWGKDIPFFAEAARPTEEEPYRDWEYEDWVAWYEEQGGDIDEDLREAIEARLMRDWLTYFRETAPRMVAGAP